MRAFILGVAAGAAGLWLAERAANRSVASGRDLAEQAPPPARGDAHSAVIVNCTCGLIEEGLAHLDERSAMQWEFEPIHLPR